MVDDIVLQIVQLVKEQPDLKNKQIVSVLKEAGFEISETSVRWVRNRHRPRSLKEELASPPSSLLQMARIARRIEEYDLPHQQMQIFQEELGPEPYDYPHPTTTSEATYLELLRRGQRCKYVGGLLYNPILNRLHFNSIIEAIYAEFYDQQKTGYPLAAIFQALFYMLFFHFP